MANDIEMVRRVHRSSSVSIPMNALYQEENALVSHTGPLLRVTSRITPSGDTSCIEQENGMIHQITMDDNGNRRNEHLLRSGPLGLCNDPNCVVCPAVYKTKRATDCQVDNKQNNNVNGETEQWAWKSFSFLCPYLPIMNPHTGVVQKWNRCFVIFCLLAVFVDPLFFFLFRTQQDNMCIVLNWSFAIVIAIVRSVTDFVYLLHMLLQFRLAYVNPESRVVGAGDFVAEPKKIALHYLRGYFLLDLYNVFPLPQVIILFVIPRYLGSSAANYAKNLIRAVVLLQYIPRIYRFFPLLAGESTSGFIFESSWVNFIINLLLFVLAGHVVGSCWYLFGLQRVNQCLHEACSGSNVKYCNMFIDCGRGNNINLFNSKGESWQDWRNNGNASACFTTTGSFQYGVYQQAVLLTAERSIIRRYLYSLFWGFLQISTMAGNLAPSYFEGEVLFVMAIVGLGLLLFALLIGNMQNFLQGLERRKLEMQLRRRDVEQWMRHRRLPEELRRQVRQAERFSWAATRGVDERELMENLPDDLQREIRRHFFKFLKNVRIFSQMDEPLLDAIYEKLIPKIFIGGSHIVYKGGPLEKMLFIVRGKLESIGEDGIPAPLSEGDVCGEELLSWCLEHFSISKHGGEGKIKLPITQLLSSRTVRCLTNVEAFALRAADLEDVTALFARVLRNPKVKGEMRSKSPYWRTIAAIRIQVAWRYRQKQRQLKRASSSGSGHGSVHPSL